MEHEGDDDTNDNWYTLNNPQRLGKLTRRGGNQWTGEDHPDYSFMKIGKTPEKDPEDWQRLVVIQTQLKKTFGNAGAKISQRCKMINCITPDIEVKHKKLSLSLLNDVSVLTDHKISDIIRYHKIYIIKQINTNTWK